MDRGIDQEDGMMVCRARSMWWVAALGLVLLPSLAHGRTFAAGSLIIPRDECYQYGGSKAVASLEAYCGFGAAVPFLPPYDAAYLAAAKTSDSGSLRSYGLEWFLLTNGVTVYTIINPTKAGAPGCPAGDETPASDGKIDGRDFCVAGGPGVTPVKRLTKTSPVGAETDIFNPATLLGTSNIISYRGSPIIIDAADAAKAKSLIFDGTYAVGGIVAPTPVRWGVTTTAGAPAADPLSAIPAPGFTKVDIHVAKVGFDAEVYASTNAAPKILAVGDAEKSSILITYLAAAGLSGWVNGGVGMAGGCTPGFVPDGMPGCTGHGKVWDIVTHAAAGVDHLTNPANGYRVMWFPHYKFWNEKRYGGGTSNNQIDEELLFGNKLRAFLDASNSVVGACASIESLENTGPSLLAYRTTCTGYEATCADGGRFTTTTGISINSAPRPWGGTNGSPDVPSATQKFSHEDVGHPFVQFGNALYFVEGGTVVNWRPLTGLGTAKAGTTRLITTRDTAGDVLPNPRYVSGAWVNGDDTDDDWDTATVRYKDNGKAANKGLIVYYGQHEFTSGKGGVVAGSRLFLNTMFVIEHLSVPVIKEVSRSSPLVITGPAGTEADTYIYQGTSVDVQPPPSATAIKFDPTSPATAAAWVFPATVGHFRIYTQNQLTTSRQDFEAVPSPVWDGKDQIPSANTTNPVTCDGTNRCVFTATLGASVATGVNRLNLQAFTDGWIAAAAAANVCYVPTVARSVDFATKVRGATLGGIDRSSPAYIEHTTYVPNGAGRTNMAYVGAQDGMFHAFATRDIKAGTGLPAWNTLNEQWAFIPPNQIPRLWNNKAEVQASPAVADFFADFVDVNGDPGQDGRREWTTLVTLSATALTNGTTPCALPGPIPGDYNGDCTCGPLDAAEGAAPGDLSVGQGTIYALAVGRHDSGAGGTPGSPVFTKGPQPLWASSPPGMGQVAGTAMAVAGCTSTQQSLVYATSKIPGIFAAGVYGGFNVFALDAATGKVVWTFSRTFTKAPQGAGQPQDANVVPGVPVAIDKTGNTGCATHLYVSDVEGKIWELNAATGMPTGSYISPVTVAVTYNGVVTATSASPLYDVSADGNATLGSCNSATQIKCPIGPSTVVRDVNGKLHVVMITGYYPWMAGGIQAKIISLDVSNSASVVTDWVNALGVDERVYASPVIIGNDVYVISAISADVNAIATYASAAGNGAIYKIRLTGVGAGTVTTVLTGTAGMMSASTLKVGSGGKVIATGGQGILKVDNTVTADPAPLNGPGTPARVLLWLENLR